MLRTICFLLLATALHAAASDLRPSVTLNGIMANGSPCSVTFSAPNIYNSGVYGAPYMFRRTQNIDEKTGQVLSASFRLDTQISSQFAIPSVLPISLKPFTDSYKSPVRDVVTFSFQIAQDSLLGGDRPFETKVTATILARTDGTLLSYEESASTQYYTMVDCDERDERCGGQYPVDNGPAVVQAMACKFQ